MTKRNLFINVVFLLIAILFSAISQCSSALSNKRLCYDPECSELISLARTSIKYIPNEEGLLPFDINVEVKVYSKEAGNRTDLWGIEINGKRGYAPKTFLKEFRVFHKDLSHEVPIKQVSNNNNKSTKKLQPKKNKNKLKSIGEDKALNAQIDNLDLMSTEELPHNVIDVTPVYEIIDGTKFYLDHNKHPIQPNFVTEVVQTTVVPNKEDPVDNSKESSNSKKVETTIFTKDKLPKEISSVKIDDEQTIPQKVNIKDFVTGSEEIFDLPEITGVHVPPLDVNVSLNSNNLDEEKHITQSIKNNTTTEGKDAQSLEELNDINVPEVSIFDNDKEVLNKDISDNNVNDKVDVELNKGDKTDSTEAVASNGTKAATETAQNITTFSIKDTFSLENVIELETEQIKLGEDLETENNLTIPVTNEHVAPLLVGSDVKDELKATLSSNNIEEVADEQIDNINLETTTAELNLPNHFENTEFKIFSDTATVLPISLDTDSNLKENNNVTIGINEGDSEKDKSKISSDTATVSSTSADTVLNLKNNSVINEGGSDNGKVKISSDIGTISATEADNDKNEVTVTSNTTIGSPTSQKIVLNLKESNNDTTVTSEGGSDDGDIKISSDIATVLPTSQDMVPNVTESEENSKKELQKDIVQDIQYGTQYYAEKVTNETTVEDDLKNDTNVHVTNTNDVSHSIEIPHVLNKHHATDTEESNLSLPELQHSNENSMVSENVASINEFRNRNLLHADTGEQIEIENMVKDEIKHLKDEDLLQHKYDTTVDDKNLYEHSDIENTVTIKEAMTENILDEVQVSLPDVCISDNVECSIESKNQNYFTSHEETSQNSETAIIMGLKVENSYWLTLMYLSVTATATLIFSLGYYYIENMRRDRQLIAKINKLEKDLLISTKECTMLNENLKLTKDKLTSIEDESFGSNEMVSSLKADLEASQNTKTELEDQIAMLEKDLESATEAGLELERMLREVLSSDNEVNPLAQSVEDLQTRLNVQQAANESLTNALNLKTQELEFDKLENESLSAELTSFKKKYEELEVELTRVTENLKLETNKVQQLEMQIKEISVEKAALQKELKGKEVETKDLVDVINRLNSNNLDLDKLYDVSRIKAEATALLEERNELKIRLTEVEGAHNLLEEHVKVIKEEVATMSKQCKLAEKEKKDAETRLEVLSNFFQEKEAQRQKEEAIWLQQQGEVVSTVERIQTMQNEIQNYKQQIEMLKHEILDQEREYKSQISLLETKAHEQWVIARQVERRLEESKVEAGQLRNRLTLIEKNINDVDPEVKLHRLEANSETATSPPLFIGAESSSSPIMFSGSSSVPPPPPPSYLHSLFPPYLPPPLPNASGVPPYEVSQRPPPLGGRLSSPPPMPLHPPASSRYDNAGSPPPMSPHLLPPFNHRSPPPPFGSDRIHPPPPPPPGSILPPPLGTTHSWGEESLPPPRNSGFHPPQRERERVRNHKGSLHSSRESLDKIHHSSKV